MKHIIINHHKNTLNIFSRFYNFPSLLASQSILGTLLNMLRWAYETDINVIIMTMAGPAICDNTGPLIQRRTTAIVYSNMRTDYTFAYAIGF